MNAVWWSIFAVLVVAVLAFRVIRPLLSLRSRRRISNARRLFRQQRERLEAKCYALASQSGKPRGLRWTECEFDDEVTFARGRRDSRLAAFVASTIAFEAIEGGGMEDVEAVSNLRAATAVFEFDGRDWDTNGRIVFNLNPVEAVAYYQDHLVLVPVE